MLGVFDRDDRLARVIGKIVNIDEEKKGAPISDGKGRHGFCRRSLQQADYGGNDQVLSEREGRHGKHALLMIDIDNFKGINDDYGTGQAMR